MASVDKRFILVMGLVWFASLNAFAKKDAVAIASCGVASDLSVNTPCWMPPATLHPTQFAVGFREVEEKKDKILAKDDSERSKYLGKHVIPVVRGPGNVLYLTDGHHLAAAATRADLPSVAIELKQDFSKLSVEDFWKEMKTRGFVHLFNEKGEPQTPDQLPIKISDLKNDIYRDLAASVRDEANLETDKQPFAEFRWANFLRTRIKKQAAESDYAQATREGIALITEEMRLTGKTQPVTEEQQRVITQTLLRLGPQAPCGCLNATSWKN